MELLIKSTCGDDPKPSLSGADSGSGANSSFDSGFDSGD